MKILFLISLMLFLSTDSNGEPWEIKGKITFKSANNKMKGVGGILVYDLPLSNSGKIYRPLQNPVITNSDGSFSFIYEEKILTAGEKAFFIKNDLNKPKLFNVQKKCWVISINDNGNQWGILEGYIYYKYNFNRSPIQDLGEIKLAKETRENIHKDLTYNFIMSKINPDLQFKMINNNLVFPPVDSNNANKVEGKCSDEVLNLNKELDNCRKKLKECISLSDSLEKLPHGSSNYNIKDLNDSIIALNKQIQILINQPSDNSGRLTEPIGKRKIKNIDTPRSELLNYDLQTIYFDKNDSRLKEDEKLKLNNIIKNLTSISLISIISHTDDDGSAEFNYQLSVARANSIKNFIVAKGIDFRRIAISSMGKNEPLNNGISEKEKQMNRRAEIIIYSLSELDITH